MAGNFWDNDPVSAPVRQPKSISPTDQKRVADIQQGFDEANNLATLAADFMTRNARTSTGGLLALPGATTVAKATGLGGPDLVSMDRDSTQMATNMRSPGMRLTQMEFGKFIGASPSTHTSYDNNRAAAENIYAARTGAAAKSAFYTRWLAMNGNLDGADGAWLNYQRQHFSPDLKQFYADPSRNPMTGGGGGSASQSRPAGAPQIIDFATGKPLQ
jgi:hypothetical protein